MSRNHNKIIPSVYAVFVKEDKIFLLKRKNTGFLDGMYDMIAGHVELGESFTQALVREAKEEAGVVIDIKDVKVIHIINKKGQEEGSSDRLDIFVQVSKWEGEIQNMEPEIHEELGWYDMDNLPENIVPYVKQGLRLGLIKGEMYSEMYWD